MRIGRPPKISLDDFREIQEWIRKRKALPSRKDIAKRYGLSIATVDRLLHGYNPWRESAGEFDSRRANGELCRESPHNSNGQHL